MSTAPVCPPVRQGSDAALVAELGALETRLHSTWAQILSVVAEIDSRGTAATVGYPTTVELLRAVTRVPLGEARARIAADVKVIRSVLARIPPHLGAETRGEVEAELAHHARTLDAGQLAVLGKRILTYLDQDGPRPNDTPETRRHLSFRDRDGGHELAGWLDREVANRHGQRYPRIPPTTMAGWSAPPQSPPPCP